MGKLEAGQWEVPLWKGTALEDGEGPLSRRLKDVGKGTVLVPRAEHPKHPGQSKPHNGYLLEAEEQSSQVSVQKERRPHCEYLVMATV